MSSLHVALTRTRRSLQARIVFLMAIGLLMPMAVSAWMGWRAFGELGGELGAARQTLARAVADHLEYAVRSDLEILQALGSATALELERRDPAAARSAVREAYLRSRFLDAVLLLGEGGEVVWEEPARARQVASPLAGLPVVADVFLSGRPTVTGLVGDVGGPRHVYALVPLRDWRGRVTRVVAGDIDPESARFSSLLLPLRLGEHGSTDLVDDRGVVIVTTDPGRRYLTTNGAEGNEAVSVAPLAVVPWRVVVRQPADEALAPIGSLRRRLLGLGPALLAIAVVFAWGAARSIRKPIAVLTGAAERIAAGDLERAIPPLGEDEVGRLGRSLDRMRLVLRDSLDGIARVNQELEARVAARTRELERLYAQLREREERRGELLRKVIQAQEDERRRIARELHDETSQSLTALVMALEAALTTLPAGGAHDRLEKAKRIGVRALDELHRLLFDLRPSVLDDLGLVSAIRWYAERQLEPLGIAVRCEFSGLDRRLPVEVETALFRVAQEALTNVARHADAETVLVQCALREGVLTIEIEDDGKGFEPETLATPQSAGRGLGLLGMRERVELLGGRLEIDAAPGQGTRIDVVVPVGGSDE